MYKRQKVNRVVAHFQRLAEHVPYLQANFMFGLDSDRGDSPVEYWSEEEPEEPRPFGLNEVNRRLAALGREPA